MRPLLYVVDDVGSEHPLEMTPAVDKHVVEALGTDCPHDPLGEGVGSRRPDRRADDPHLFRLEHAVEGARELGVPVVQEEPDAHNPFIDRPGSWPAGRPRPSRDGPWHPPGALAGSRVR